MEQGPWFYARIKLRGEKNYFWVVEIKKKCSLYSLIFYFRDDSGSREKEKKASPKRREAFENI